MRKYLAVALACLALAGSSVQTASSQSADQPTLQKDTLQITAWTNNSYKGNYGDVDTGSCAYSACAGFDATLVLEDKGETVTEIYSFEGWAVADTGTSFFTISRMRNRVGT